MIILFMTNYIGIQSLLLLNFDKFKLKSDKNKDTHKYKYEKMKKYLYRFVMD